MKSLPFDHIGRDDTHPCEKARKEQAMNADEIKANLLNLLGKAGFLTRCERSHGSYGRYCEHPFDVAAGDPDVLEMYGFEIKADADSYERLRRQVLAYLHVFHAVYIVLHHKVAPEWLPEGIGVIRAFKDGSFMIEQYAQEIDPLDIGAQYLWDALWSVNGLSANSKRSRELLRLTSDIRKNVLFNRFFGYGFSEFDPRGVEDRHWLFTAEQRELLVGFDFPTQYKKFKKDLSELEDRLSVLKAASGVKT